MQYSDFKTRALRTFGPALALERQYSARARQRIERFLDVLLWLVIFIAMITVIAERTDLLATFPEAEVLLAYSDTVYGVLAILLGLRIPFFLLDAFYASYYFEGLDTTLHEHGRGEGTHMSLDVAWILYRTPDTDLTRGFLTSQVGRHILARCGIFEDEIEGFLSSERSTLSASSLRAEFQEDTTVSSYVATLFAEDEAFAQFLFSHALQESDLLGAAHWVEYVNNQAARERRFWSRDNLGRIPGIGKAWSYGQAYNLEKYSSYIREMSVYGATARSSAVGKRELDLLETTLVRAHDTNAVLVGEEGIGKLEILARLARRIDTGAALPPIEHKRIVVFDGDGLIAGTQEKGAFEQKFTALLNEAVGAGNIILVIERLPGFIASARTLGSDVVNLLEPYLTSNGIQIVATSDQSSFHEVIDPDARLMRRFESILVGSADETSTLRVLEDTALEAESKHNVFFTYPALVAIRESAERYFPSGVMPDKAVDLLAEIVPTVVERGTILVSKEDVLNLVEAKTGVPLGEVDEQEKEKLLNLEDLLHERIVGQDEAVQALAHAMQRARSGLRSQNRPMGSFLFLGPTGVGKTETAKTLARVFFGSEDNMLRLDMSEYSTDNAVSRLIGSFESGKAGTLVSMLREQQYGVLLLDEFEKTSSAVLDLFLQIFDEGQFSDAQGKKVNARNVIIIATSNAGSDLIWNYFQEGADVSAHKDELVNAIIERGVLKPELLNRFDGTVVFHPLTEEHIRRIAGLMLEEVQDRLKEQGVELVINEELISMLVEEGYDPEFGARPMSRAIADRVEQVVAEKMLRGEVNAGERVELKAEDVGATS